MKFLALTMGRSIMWAYSTREGGLRLIEYRKEGACLRFTSNPRYSRTQSTVLPSFKRREASSQLL